MHLGFCTGDVAGRVACIMTTLVAISGGLSQHSEAAHLARALGERAAHYLDAELHLLSLGATAEATARALATGQTSAELEEQFDALDAAAAIVAVAPIYNAQPSGIFTTFMDLVPKETLQGKPVGLGATGGSLRHALVLESALRPMFTFLRASLATTAIYATRADWGGEPGAFVGRAGHRLELRIDREARELAELVAVTQGRASGGWLAGAPEEYLEGEDYAAPVPPAAGGAEAARRKLFGA